MKAVAQVHWVLIAVLAVIGGLFSSKMGGWVGKIVWPIVVLLAIFGAWNEWK